MKKEKNHEKKNEIYQVDIHLHRRLPAIVCDEGLENMFRFVRTYALGKKNKIIIIKRTVKKKKKDRLPALNKIIIIGP